MKTVKTSKAAVLLAWAVTGLISTTATSGAGEAAPAAFPHEQSATKTASSASSVVGYIKNRHSGKCLTVHGASKANNARVDQYTCVGAANQRWTFEWTGGWSYALRNAHSGKCLTVHGASKAKGAAIDQYTCVGASNQSFYINIGTPSKTPLKAAHSKKCLDVRGGSTANNAAVIQWTCNGRTNQLWSIPD
ncbi:ricin-type beta-trefoil lectin protein [Streptomyces sp. Ag82_O1-15]|uniref:RICIN domain-containing protein n=1 Tax=Streptomyces sp. Ag82_O1-15 TaxID=1938855 RepID=UPI000BB0D717|nr:RICIN domain-containing protein [Streptomyces sp. Ag82_O1-15]PBC92418.1 ricin-type beta-trefoil lectin protein [Streptomyces sp. Ag82_O1-15]